MNIDLTLLSFLEGLIEFLPISSTAHLIIASKILSIDTTDSFIKFYLLIIQFGALFAGIVLFSKKIFKNRKTFLNVCISFIPSAIIGFTFYKIFKKLLEGNMVLLATMSILGGLIFIYLEKVFMKKYSKSGSGNFGKEEISKKNAFVIGIAQAIAIIPGVSRSGATLIAGIFSGIKKSVIFEYTFMLALPTLGSAVIYDAYKSRELLMEIHSWGTIAFGLIFSFIVAFTTLYFLEKHLSKISLNAFGWYRILFGILVLFMFTSQPIPMVESSVYVAPHISISSEKIYPGDPLLVTIIATSSPLRIYYDDKIIPSFEYEDKFRALIAIPFEEIKMEYTIIVNLENGEILTRKITLTPREKIERPLGIPEKLGGNTKEAGKTLVNNLAIENKSINNIETSNMKLWMESFGNPLENFFITDQYGYNRDTVGYVIVHKGMDLRAQIGTEVFAMNNGIIRISKKYTVYGNTVVIDHGLGLNTLYMHLSELKVKEGDTVSKGDIIGLSGDSGYAESPHLHISVKVGGVSVDPEKFLDIFK